MFLDLREGRGTLLHNLDIERFHIPANVFLGKFLEMAMVGSLMLLSCRMFHCQTIQAELRQFDGKVDQDLNNSRGDLNNSG